MSVRTSSVTVSRGWASLSRLFDPTTTDVIPQRAPEMAFGSDRAARLKLWLTDSR
jgi:hypothetical protein